MNNSAACPLPPPAYTSSSPSWLTSPFTRHGPENDMGLTNKGCRLKSFTPTSGLLWLIGEGTSVNRVRCEEGVFLPAKALFSESVNNRFDVIFVSTCCLPLGQVISKESTLLSFPKPK